VGLIPDGVHVDPVMIGVALRSKQGPSKIFLVTDAMATIGTDMTSFTLNGRTIRRENGRLTLENGTLAGADLDMISAVRFMRKWWASISRRPCAWLRSIRRRLLGSTAGMGGFAQDPERIWFTWTTL
jgi:N-acetylglucosamine-6-phosphate deacetylase